MSDATRPYTAPTGLRTGAVHIAVRDLQRTASFYEELLGLERLSDQALAQDEDPAAAILPLGPPGGPPLVLLSTGPGILPRPRPTTGLYHLALLVPDRPALARVLLRLARRHIRIGSSDHLVSEALYLEDPEGNGIEVYADRPREMWHMADGSPVMSTEPLDTDALIATAGGPAAEDAGVPPGTRIGHVHLQVSEIDTAERFYMGALGLDLQARYRGEAAFLSAGGYHHHVGVNVWTTRGAPPPPADAAGLRWITLELPSDDDVAALGEHLDLSDWEYARNAGGLRLRDPAGNEIRVRSASPSPAGAE